MKNTLKISFLLAILLLMASCKDFLTRTPSTAVPEEKALLTVSDLQNAVIGLHSTVRSPGYYGRTLLVVGDIAADVTTKKFAVSDNWFAAIENYSISENMQEPAEMWALMYRACDRAARIITAGKLLANKGSDADKRNANFAIAQAYGIKALSLFHLVNVFGLPYANSDADATNPGVILVGDSIIKKEDNVVRASVKNTYEHILRDIDSAKNYAALSLKTGSFTQMNAAAIFALEARVNLYMKNYPAAKRAAQDAINKRRGSMAYTSEAYLQMWQNAAAGNEDIFVFTTNSAEQQGTSSISHFYGVPGYGGRMSPIALRMLSDDDIRRSAVKRVSGEQYQPYKYPNYSSAINKTPVFRTAEMYLILAECENELGQLNAAQNALLTVAKRNPAITTVDQLPQDANALRLFINDERVRELFAEGHRWFDLRRRADLLNRPQGESLKTITNYKVYNFCYPIPLSEINASGIAQNNWINTLPIQ